MLRTGAGYLDAMRAGRDVWIDDKPQTKEHAA